MKTAAIQALRQKLATDRPVYGLWVTLESASITEIGVALGLDWLVIDAEHGHLDWKEILEHIRAAVRSNAVVLVRIAELNGALIKRALDLGADGVVIPWIETAEQLKQAVAYATYPPAGRRGIGAERATGWGQSLVQHTQEANKHVLVVPIIESVIAGKNIEQLCQVSGADIFFFGPADYSSTAGYCGQWEGPGVGAELQTIKDKLQACGKHCGIIATGAEDLNARRDQGFRMLGLGLDTGLLLRSLHAALAAVGRDGRIQTSFASEPELSTRRVASDPLRAESDVVPHQARTRGGKHANKFVVALTGDFSDRSGVPKYKDIGLSVLAQNASIEQRVFSEHRSEIGPDQIGDVHGVIVLTPSVTARSVSNARNLLVIARFGVGYDSVDVAACTAADVLATITVGAVDRPVAEAALGWMIALSHNLRIKDGLVRTGEWDRRSQYMGRELRDRTLGVIGLGGIGRKTIELCRGFGMNQPLAYDPFISPQTDNPLDVRLVGLEDLLRQADFISVHCPLNEKTRGLLGARELDWMKPDAYLLNTARGGIVDEDALFDALKERRIAGAAVDCFAHEPITAPHRFGELDNVLLAPHSIAWTEEMFRDIGRAACGVMVDLSLGKRPRGVLNPEVFERPGFKAKWQRLL
jgi:phosphoglycerate dehydrogenase-like enzyme/2-keto-3-deoxy-L-rhamnonate aldolase RhmA